MKVTSSAFALVLALASPLFTASAVQAAEDLDTPSTSSESYGSSTVDLDWPSGAPTSLDSPSGNFGDQEAGIAAPHAAPVVDINGPQFGDQHYGKHVIKKHGKRHSKKISRKAAKKSAKHRAKKSAAVAAKSKAKYLVPPAGLEGLVIEAPDNAPADFGDIDGNQ